MRLNDAKLYTASAGVKHNVGSGVSRMRRMTIGTAGMEMKPKNGHGKPERGSNTLTNNAKPVGETAGHGIMKKSGSKCMRLPTIMFPLGQILSVMVPCNILWCIGFASYAF